MFEILGGLILLLVAAIYSAIVVGKKTDQRVMNLISEDSVDAPMQVRFPEDVLKQREAARARVRTGKQSA